MDSVAGLINKYREFKEYVVKSAEEGSLSNIKKAFPEIKKIIFSRQSAIKKENDIKAENPIALKYSVESSEKIDSCLVRPRLYERVPKEIINEIEDEKIRRGIKWPIFLLSKKEMKAVNDASLKVFKKFTGDDGGLGKIIKTRSKTLRDIFYFNAEKVNNPEALKTAKEHAFEAIISETLAKGLAYLDVPDDTKITLPQITKDDTINHIEYRVISRKLDNGLPYKILIPSKESGAPVRLVFRGTEPHVRKGKTAAWKSILNDFVKPEGVGFNSISDKDVDAIKGLLESKNSDEEVGSSSNSEDVLQVSISGHSLGGCLAQMMAKRLKESSPSQEQPNVVIKGVYGFNSPGLSQQDAKVIDADPELKSKSFTIGHGADLISKSGRAHCGTYILATHDNVSKLDGNGVHCEFLLLGWQKASFRVVNTRMANQSLLRRGIEVARVIFGVPLNITEFAKGPQLKV